MTTTARAAGRLIAALLIGGALDGAVLSAAGPGAARRAAARAGRQDPAPPATANRTQPVDGLPAVSTGELVNMLDTYAIVKAQNELTLNDTQYPQFVARLKRLQEARRRNQRARNLILQDLRRLAGPQATVPVDENLLRERLRALRDQDDRAAIEMRRAYDMVDEVLDVRQQARFRAFEETIERRKLDLMLRARERAARGGGALAR